MENCARTQRETVASLALSRLARSPKDLLDTHFFTPAPLTLQPPACLFAVLLFVQVSLWPPVRRPPALNNNAPPRIQSLAAP